MNETLSAEQLMSVRKIVETDLQERFGNIRIEAVDVTVDADEDGDEIYLVKVVYEGKAKRLDPEKTIGLARRIRPKIQALGARGFPIFSFIAKSDLGRKEAAAV